VFWSSANIVDENTRKAVLAFMRERLDRRDAVTLLSAIDDAGIDRGTLGQCVHTIVDRMAETAAVMESIATDDTLDERTRHAAILFGTSAAQRTSSSHAIQLLDRLACSVRDGDLLDVIAWLKSDVSTYGFVSYY
jgi:hypothetical protein